MQSTTTTLTCIDCGAAFAFAADDAAAVGDEQAAGATRREGSR
jgi:hypothetical protein